MGEDYSYSLSVILAKAGIQDSSTMSKEYSYFVYILASNRNGTLYIGVTNNLLRRVQEHKEGVIEGFTKKYKVHGLVYFEQTDTIDSALTREKHIKKWNRSWKLELIERENPIWKDLYFDLLEN